MKLWEITFNRNTTKSVQINFQGSTLATNRDILDNSMFSSGDPVIPKAKKDTIYIVEISENIYLEEDESKNCRNYPNADYANYKDCDDQYMKDLCKGFDGFVPIWLTNDFEQVTKQGAFQCPGFHLDLCDSIQMKTVADGLKRCYGQFEGFETSPCAFPCHTFHTQTKYVSQQGQHGHKKGRYRVTFHFLQKVSEDLKISY